VHLDRIMQVPKKMRKQKVSKDSLYRIPHRNEVSRIPCSTALHVFHSRHYSGSVVEKRKRKRGAAKPKKSWGNGEKRKLVNEVVDCDVVEVKMISIEMLL